MLTPSKKYTMEGGKIGQKDTVKELKQWSRSAGNISTNSYHYSLLPLLKDKQGFFTVGVGEEQVLTLKNKNKDKNGTSETLRNETVVLLEKLKPISEHVPKHLRPVTDEQFGHYLAGLIEADGHFTSHQQLVIVFNSLDASLAYYIKKRIGFGSVKKVKDKNAFLLVISAKKGLEKVINLINGKLITPGTFPSGENKYNQIIINILNHSRFADFKKEIPATGFFKLNSPHCIKAEVSYLNPLRRIYPYFSALAFSIFF